MNDYEAGYNEGMDAALTIYSAMGRFSGAITFKDFFDEVQDYKRKYARHDKPMFDIVDGDNVVQKTVAESRN